MVRHNADDAHPEAVLQHVDPAGKTDRPVTPQSVLADAAGLQSVQIRVQIGHPVVEIMVAQGHIVIPAAVHDLSKATGVLLGVMAESPQRGAL